MTVTKPGDQFNLEKIKNSRTVMSRSIQDNGYFYFTPEFIEFKADTLKERNRLNLIVGKNSELPEHITSVYKINSVSINEIHRSGSKEEKSDTIIFDGVSIISAGEILKNEPLVNAIHFREGDTYSLNKLAEYN